VGSGATRHAGTAHTMKASRIKLRPNAVVAVGTVMMVQGEDTAEPGRGATRPKVMVTVRGVTGRRSRQSGMNE
jgi:hypothetical protein